MSEFETINTMRYSLHNCTVCSNFTGGLEFRSDSEPDIGEWEDAIWLDCIKKGKRYCNNFLLICVDFQYDDQKDSLVARDTSYPRSIRVFHRVKKLVETDLDGIIYDLACRVCDVDPRGYLFNVCVQRVHLQTGISREVVFRCVMGMVEAGLLVRESVEGALYLRPPSPIIKIGDLGRLK